MGSVLPQPIQFGKYTLFERIGRGGMADVFKGRVQGPAGFERVFVVKRILPHLSEDPTFNKMFVEEAKMSARLSHPNIVQVFELGSVEGEFFISMEYVRGRDLAETMRVLWARIGPPRPELVAYIGREMCRALAYAHNLTDEQGGPLGLIHRDVSPSNVMLSYEGGVKILDFGIAKALGEPSKEENTRTGTLKGKFAYMAPEQTQGNDVDQRIDIFAAGIVLHEILTGRRLFKGANDLQTIERVRECKVEPPSAHNPLCPPELDAVVLHALRKNREDRFGSAADMADALDDVVHAARFQPDHLAQLMRELFPAEAPGGEIRSNTGSMSIGQVTGSNRGATPPRSATSIPPVSVSVSRSQVTPGKPPPLDLAELALPRARPLWKRPPVMAAAGTAMVLILAVALWPRGRVSSTAAPSALPALPGPPRPHRPADGKVRVQVQSTPAGADVYLETSAQPVGKTPGVIPVTWDEHIQTRITLRKAGFEDYVQELLPAHDEVLIASLKQSTAKAKPTPSPTPPSAPSAEDHGRHGSNPKGRHGKHDIKKGNLLDPFK